VAFSYYSRNRWTALGTRNAQDWVELDLKAPRHVGSVELYLWGNGRDIKAPRRYVLQYWDGSTWLSARVLSQVPLLPQVSSVNTVRSEPVTSSRIRIIFEHDLPAVSGMTEVIIRESVRP